MARTHSAVPAAVLLLLPVILVASGAAASRDGKGNIGLPLTPQLRSRIFEEIGRRNLLQTCPQGYSNNQNRQCLQQDITTSGIVGGQGSCEAGEVVITAAEIDQSTVTGVPMEPCCADPLEMCLRCSPGQVVTGDLQLTLDVNAQDRYDVGLWVAQSNVLRPTCGGNNDFQNNPAFCGTTCTKNALSLTSPATNENGNCCGDLDQGPGQIVEVPAFSFTCPDLSGVTPGPQPACPTLAATLPWCLGWSQNDNSNICVPPATANPSATLANYEVKSPGANSKCTCGVAALGGLDRFIPTCDDVDPDDGVTTPFNCAATPGWAPIASRFNLPLGSRWGPASLQQCCYQLPSLDLTGPASQCLTGTSTTLTYAVDNSAPAGTGVGPATNVDFTLTLAPTGGALSVTAINCVTRPSTATSGGTAVPGFCPGTPINPATTINCGTTGVLILPPGQQLVCTFSVSAPASVTSFTAAGTVPTGAVDSQGAAIAGLPLTTAATFTRQATCVVGETANTATCGCDPNPCNPCPDTNPNVFLATSGTGSWPNSIWVVKQFTRSTSSPTVRSAEYVCRLRASTSTSDGITPGAFIGDIAFLWEGSLLVVDTAGRIGFVPKTDLDILVSSSVNSGITDIQGINQASSTFSKRVCPYKRITGAAPGGTTGIANGFDSSEYVLSTFSGAVTKFKIRAAQTSGPLTTSSVLTATFSGTGTASATIPPSPFSSASGAAGTDVVAGPFSNVAARTPKRFFRWVSANNADITTQGSDGTDWATQAMHYSGTRLNAATLASEGYVSWGTANGATPAPVIKPGGCSLPGDPTFGKNPACDDSTSANVAVNTPYTQSNFKNAGAFCTSSTVFGTAFCNPERQNGDGTWAFTNYACNGRRSDTDNPGTLVDVAGATEWEVARFFEFGVRGGTETSPETSLATGSPAPVFGGAAGVPPTAVATATIKTRLPLFVIGAATAPSCPVPV